MYITVNGIRKKIKQNTKYLDLAMEVRDQYPYDILLAKQGYVLKELNGIVKEGDDISFLTAADEPGMNTYERSLLFLLLYALKRKVGVEKMHKLMVDFSVRKGLLIETGEDITVTAELLEELKADMVSMVKEALPITKKSVPIAEAKKRMEEQGFDSKSALFRFRRSSSVNLYTIGDFDNYFYGYMVPDTSYLKYFDLCEYEGNIILLMPDRKEPTKVNPLNIQKKVYASLMQSVMWGKMMEVSTIGDLNCMIADNRINELMLVQEALMESRLSDIAQEIVRRKDVKFVMIAGPSSSGKTTTSRRLSIQLKAHGLKPHAISVDNYFVDREKTPRDENGDYDYECLEALDLKLFNQNMSDLLTGKTVSLPTFNFVEGKMEYKGDTLTLGEGDILVIEGIHALNAKMSESLPEESKYKIYLSALTPLNIDEHNRISTSDGRLVRRMVRDARTRGAQAKDTIARWNSVRQGEEKNIFPYQEEADVVFNSSLIYELPVLKSLAEPLLFQVPENSPEGVEAKRLLKFFDYFLAAGTDYIPINSILREFVGGSCFDV